MAYTFLRSISEWKCGNKCLAYQYYLIDEGQKGQLSFDNFCIEFPKIVKKHDENIANEEAHAKSIRVD